MWLSLIATLMGVAKVANGPDNKCQCLAASALRRRTSQLWRRHSIGNRRKHVRHRPGD